MDYVTTRGFRVQGLGLRVQGLGFRIWNVTHTLFWGSLFLNSGAPQPFHENHSITQDCTLADQPVILIHF